MIDSSFFCQNVYFSWIILSFSCPFLIQICPDRRIQIRTVESNLKQKYNKSWINRVSNYSNSINLVGIYLNLIIAWMRIRTIVYNRNINLLYSKMKRWTEKSSLCHKLSKELSFCHKLWYSNFNIVAIQCRRPLIFQTMNSIWSNNLSLKY